MCDRSPGGILAPPERSFLRARSRANERDKLDD
jgi:hypothetical protein